MLWVTPNGRESHSPNFFQRTQTSISQSLVLGPFSEPSGCLLKMQRNFWALSWNLWAWPPRNLYFAQPLQVIQMYARVWEPLIRVLPSQIYALGCQTWWHPRKLEVAKAKGWIRPGLCSHVPDLSMRGGAGVMRTPNTQPAGAAGCPLGSEGGGGGGLGRRRLLSLT